MQILVRRGEIATNLNIPPPTIKHYIEMGLFEPASRTPRGQLLFDFEEVFKRYEMISELKTKRLTLEEIKQELDKEFSSEN